MNPGGVTGERPGKAGNPDDRGSGAGGSLSRRDLLVASIGAPVVFSLGVAGLAPAVRPGNGTKSPPVTVPPAPQGPAPTGGVPNVPDPTGGVPTGGVPTVPPDGPSAGEILGHRLGPAVGDGSTSLARPQPNQPPIVRLAPGETPPQFVVFSWDGSSALAPDSLARFRRVARRTHAAMTFFLTGLYLVPEAQRRAYHAPGRAPGASAISFMSASTVHRTIAEIGQAWVEGNEIGTHFNGHFCGAGGAATWSSRAWRKELGEVEKFVSTWRSITGFDDLPPLPFTFDDIVGGRTPCLEGRRKLLPVINRLGWRYDSSGTRPATWPRRDRYGIWNLSMHPVPFGRHRLILPMDYNFLVNQPGPDTRANRRRWRHQAEHSLLAGLQHSRRGNRAPLIIGNHFSPWRHGLYLDAVEASIERFAGFPDVRLVSFRQLVDWLEAQDPDLLHAWQRRPADY